MRYEPSFFEAFLVWTLTIPWSRWLLRRGAPSFYEWLPWAGGLAVLLGQVLGAASLFGATTELDPSRSSMLLLARWGPMAAVLAVLALELAATIVVLSARRARGAR